MTKGLTLEKWGGAQPFDRVQNPSQPDTVDNSSAPVQHGNFPIVQRSEPASVAIIHHESSLRKYENDSLLASIAQRWINRGIKVTNLYGTSKFVPADIAIVHVDLSVVPKEYCDLAKRYPVALNAFVTDIRKRSFSVLEVTDPETYDGPVIVKTDLNSGGLPERRALRNRWPGVVRAVHRLLEKTHRRYGKSSRVYDASAGYKIFASAKDVPPNTYNDPDLLVEKFVTERMDGWYCYRRYYFLGDAEVCQLWRGTQPICVEDDGRDSGQVYDVSTPPSLRAFRCKLSIQYGKIDYVHDDAGQVIVFDVNKTPGGVCHHAEDEPWLYDLCDRLEVGFGTLTQSKP